MSTTADTTRQLGPVHRGAQPFRWSVLRIGHVQPRGYRTYWSSRWLWQLHLTPLHMARDVNRWEFGICLGRRTLYLYSQR